MICFSTIIIPKLYFAIASKNQILEEMEESVTGSAYGLTETADVPMVTNQVIAHSDIINDALFPTDYTAGYTFLPMFKFPLVFVGMFAVWICCYLLKREITKIEVIYLCSLVMGIFLLTVKIHPYWGILIVPYFSLLIVLNPDKFRENILLDTLISVGYVVNKAILYYWCFGMAQIERMVGPEHVFSYDPEVSNTGKYGLAIFVYKLSSKVGISEENIAHTFSALLVVAFVLFMVINRPDKIEKSEVIVGDIEGYQNEMIIRLLFSLFVAVMPMIGILVYLTPAELWW